MKKIVISVFLFFTIGFFQLTNAQEFLSNNVRWVKSNKIATDFEHQSIPKNYSRLVFLRVDNNSDVNSSTNIAIDGRFQSSLQKNHISQSLVCKGNHLVSTAKTEKKTNDLFVNPYLLKTKEGKTHYILVDPKGYKVTALEISEQEALQMLKKETFLEQHHQISRVKATCSDADDTAFLHIEFDFDKSNVLSKYSDDLRKFTDFLHKVSNAKVLIEGHTDNKGTSAYNFILSLHRAENVRDKLVKEYGFNPKNIHIKAFGATIPSKTNDTEKGRQFNRRADIFVLKQR